MATALEEFYAEMRERRTVLVEERKDVAKRLDELDTLIGKLDDLLGPVQKRASAPGRGAGTKQNERERQALRQLIADTLKQVTPNGYTSEELFSHIEPEWPAEYEAITIHRIGAVAGRMVTAGLLAGGGAGGTYYYVPGEDGATDNATEEE